jgi:tRNA-splicing ligase RtcB
MDSGLLEHPSEFEWRVPPTGRMRVPGIIYASQRLILEMEATVLEQVRNVASLPGIERAAYAMPDAHWGYGFPIGGVAAFDPERDGVISAGGVGFDISCGVRMLLTALDLEDVAPLREKLADALFHNVPAGVGSTGDLRLNDRETDAMLRRGAAWAVERGYGTAADFQRIEGRGVMRDADPAAVSEQARKRQRDEMGTLGSGNHYLEVQAVAEIFDPATADAYGLRKGQIVVGIHCGSRGLGHQVATDFSKSMVVAAGRHGIALADRELACAPIRSETGQAYLGAMRSAVNCALANRQILGHLVRTVFQKVTGTGDLPLLYDVSHNVCSVETHEIGGQPKTLFMHRKGATRALGPGHPDLPDDLRGAGQPVLVGGTMGTSSYVLAGVATSEELSFSSACHGAGRAMSRSQATKRWRGQDVIDDLGRRGILIRSRSYRGIAEEAPGAYKDVSEVVEATEQAGLARKVAKLKPLVCVKG